MPRLSLILLILGVASVSLLQQSRDCWAAETTQQGGYGQRLCRWRRDGRRQQRKWRRRLRRSPRRSRLYRRPAVSRPFGRASGVVATRAACRTCRRSPNGTTQEPSCWAESQRSWNGLDSPSAATSAASSRPTESPAMTPGPVKLGSKTGFRLGAGYSFSLVEFRVGALWASSRAPARCSPTRFGRLT